MEIQIEGVVRKVLPLQEGEGRNGRWRKQQYVIETQSGQYPKQICAMVWGDKIDQFNLVEGEEVTASIDIESREYNERWYTDIRIWKIQRKSSASESVALQNLVEPSHITKVPDLDQEVFSIKTNGNQDNDDDLPF